MRGLSLRNQGLSIVHTVAAAVIFFVAAPELVWCQQDARLNEDLARRADAIVIAKVTGLTSAWNSDRSRIYTTVTLAIDEQLKGEGTGTMSISTPGGEVDGVGEVYSHVPRFKLNEQVVVFAQRDTQGRFQLVGGIEGKMSVIIEESTGRQLVADHETLQGFAVRVKAIVQEQSQR